ncbi:MAG: SIS domain-containing protein [Spirochaetaceae bacterium]|nr:SIS domain-containing protein [Spirochaetaceae bacterium]
MAREIAEIPAVAARQVSLGLTEYRALGVRLRKRAPAVIVTCARGSSDNAAVYLKYLVETRVGIPVAAIGPSVASVYDARLSLDRAVCVTISQSGGSPDLVSLQDHARAGGAATLALLNTRDSPVGSSADEVVPVMAGPETAVAATKSLVASLVAIAGIVAGWTDDGALARGLEALPESLAASLACGWLICRLVVDAARLVEDPNHPDRRGLRRWKPRCNSGVYYRLPAEVEGA